MLKKIGVLFIIGLPILFFFSGKIRLKEKFEPNIYNERYTLNNLPIKYQAINNKYTLFNHNSKRYGDHLEIEFTNYSNSIPTFSIHPDKINSKTFLYTNDQSASKAVNILTIIPSQNSTISTEDLGLPIVYDKNFSGYVFQYSYDFVPQYLFTIYQGKLQSIKILSQFPNNQDTSLACEELYEIKQGFDKIKGQFVPLSKGNVLRKNWCHAKILDPSTIKTIKNHEELPLITSLNPDAVFCKVGCVKEIDLRKDTVYKRAGFLCQKREQAGVIESKLIIKCHTIKPFIYSAYFNKNDSVTEGFVEVNPGFYQINAEEATAENMMTAKLTLNYNNSVSYIDTIKCYGILNKKSIKFGNTIKGTETMTRGYGKEYVLNFE